jgi:LuxR family maltose regulon positive regulatory protein
MSPISDALITTKISIPPARMNIVHRGDLLEQLDSCVSKKLCLVLAPAGFGKTTLLSDWASQHDLPLSWFSLDEGDNDTDRFLIHLLSALETVEPRLQLVENSKALRQAPGATPVDTILTLIVNELDKLQAPLGIVLDDYHLIANQNIHDIMSFLLDHLPDPVHLIVASRTNPTLPLAKLRARGQLLEISEVDLRFTTQEGTRFLQDVMGLDLSPEDSAALERRTEGWVTGLQLAALSLEGRQDPSEFIASLSGTHRYILDYLAEEVFTKLPEMLQIFLLRISPLGRFNGDLCDTVVGELFQKDWQLGIAQFEQTAALRSKIILEFLDNSHLFVFPLDYERKWYRFHPLFSEFLQDSLAENRPDEVPLLHRRASEWFSDHGFITEAIHHALLSQDTDRAADLIVGQVKGALVQGETSRLIHWIEELPSETLSKKPALELGLLWALLLSDPIRFGRRIHEHFAQLKESLGVDERTVYERLGESDAGLQDRVVLSEFALLVAYLSREQGDFGQTIALFEATLKAMPAEEHFTQSFALAGLASTYAGAGQLKMAESAFARAAEHGRKSGSAYAFIASKDWEATMQGQQGRLNQAAGTYQTAINYISETGVEGLPLTGHAYVGLAEIQLEKNELDAALAYVEQGIRRGKQVNDTDALREGYLIKARILVAMGDEGGYLEAIERGIEIAREIPGTSCLEEAKAWAAILNIVRGEITSAANWASSRGLSVPIDLEMIDGLQEIERRAFGRLLLAQRKMPEAETVLESLLKWTEENGLVRTNIEALTLLSLVLYADGRKEQSLRNLARALLLAEPEGFVRTFVDCGPTMAALLQSAAAQGHSPEYVKQLVKAYGKDASPEAPLDPLTERELDVLRLVATGLTNAEIASELVVAQSTVKTHINRIYSKLAVTRRTQAVAKARELGLLQ